MIQLDLFGINEHKIDYFKKVVKLHITSLATYSSEKRQKSLAPAHAPEVKLLEFQAQWNIVKIWF